MNNAGYVKEQEVLLLIRAVLCIIRNRIPQCISCLQALSSALLRLFFAAQQPAINISDDNEKACTAIETLLCKYFACIDPLKAETDHRLFCF